MDDLASWRAWLGVRQPAHRRRALDPVRCAAADGGLLAGFQSNVKASAFITSFSFAIYVAACLAGPLLLDRRRRGHHHSRPRPPGGRAIPGGVRTGGWVRRDG